MNLPARRRFPARCTMIAAAAAALLAGCGDDAAMVGAGAGATHPASESVAAGPTGIAAVDDLFASTAPPPAPLDTSITDSVAAWYGPVPGADTMDASAIDAGGLASLDDPFASAGSSADGILASDGGLSDTTMAMDLEPLSGMDSMMDTGPVMDDAGFDPGLDDGSLSMGAPMIDDASLTDSEPMLDDPSLMDSELMLDSSLDMP